MASGLPPQREKKNPPEQVTLLLSVTLFQVCSSCCCLPVDQHGMTHRGGRFLWTNHRSLAPVTRCNRVPATIAQPPRCLVNASTSVPLRRMKSWLNRERGDDKFRAFPREESWLPVPVPRTKILPVKVKIKCPSVGEREESDLILDGEVVEIYTSLIGCETRESPRAFLPPCDQYCKVVTVAKARL